MLVVSPVRSERLSLHAAILCDVVSSIGTRSYGNACLSLLSKSLNVQHWALFRFPSNSPPNCLAAGNACREAAVQENIDQFVIRCHNVDPSVKAVSKRSFVPTLTTMDISDIEDPQYRHCFEVTRVQERISFFSWIGPDLYQLSAFRVRGSRTSRFSSAEMNCFATLAELLLATAQKHAIILDQSRRFSRNFDVKGIERQLKQSSFGLSMRECEVCARAAAGKTIEGTSVDLDIRPTSVITYRQRAYQKLGISRTNELVGLLVNLDAETILDSRSSEHDAAASRRRAS
jgi:DNA-binding CsgD family transcriptional regulator